MNIYCGMQLEGWKQETEAYPSLLSLAYGNDEHDYTAKAEAERKWNTSPEERAAALDAVTLTPEDEEDWSDHSVADYTSVYTSYKDFPEVLRELATNGKGIDEECNVIPTESDPEVVKAALRAWLEEANFGYIYFNREYLVEQGLSEEEISTAEEAAEKRKEEEPYGW